MQGNDIFVHLINIQMISKTLEQHSMKWFFLYSFHSSAYLDVILRGAEESQLPKDYFSFLKSIAHNGNLATPDMLAKLFGDN